MTLPESGFINQDQVLQLLPVSRATVMTQRNLHSSGR